MYTVQLTSRLVQLVFSSAGQSQSSYILGVSLLSVDNPLFLTATILSTELTGNSPLLNVNEKGVFSLLLIQVWLLTVTVASNKFWSSMLFQNLVRLSQINSYFYIKCAKRVFFVHEKVFYVETKVEAV
jgi:hypothetical protein